MKLTNFRPIIHYEHSVDWGYAHKDNVEIMFCAPNAHIPFEKTLITGSLYINKDDVDAWWEKLKNKCEVIYSLETFSYNMREFAIKLQWDNITIWTSCLLVKHLKVNSGYFYGHPKRIN
ncbi:VOC family protein [Pedobacter rhizosphaerae]|uniref:Uncharacterized protein n=1 Tax=Pedobacter rhizosphaerae TaxID=390241 RepID=A0A1H9R2F7_9SPHI|nr:hypothetical protein [Pedobacter rhizosphaerae]SER66797.1 hypothetical protein SAMN04488023_11396 [Pedobacter rhizosphaerae]